MSFIDLFGVLYLASYITHMLHKHQLHYIQTINVFFYDRFNVLDNFAVLKKNFNNCA